MDDEPTPVVDRHGLEFLTYDECWELLASSPVGRIAFMHDGVPEILPVTHAVTGGRIVFRSAEGTKLGAATMAPAVGFEVDAWDPLKRSGWSVLAKGTAESTPPDSEELDGLGLESWLPSVSGGTWISIRVDDITGRRLNPGTV